VAPINVTDLMRTAAKVALVIVAVSAGFGVASCTRLDELRDTISGRFATGKVLGENQGTQTVEPANKLPVSFSPEPSSQKVDSQRTSSQTVPSRLRTPRPEAPASGTFSH
jgi:hypothetical protein